jgi:hypothetical protein
MIRTYPAVALGMLLFALSVSAGESRSKPIEMRNHFRITGQEGAVLYDITEVIRLADEVEENRLLIHDEGHGDFLMNRIWSYETQTITHRLNDLKDRAFVQISLKMPFTSKTRLETIAEAKRNPILVDTPAVVRLETNGGQWEGVHDDWDEYGRLRQFRHELRQTLDPFMLEALERMRGTVLTLPGTPSAFYERVARFVVYDQRSDEAPVSVQRVDAQPDCDFDKSFGFPCSEKQLERVKKAVKDGSVLSTY